MQITGTKKLIIILLSTVCAFAAGLGVLFGGGVGAQAEKADGGTVSSVTDRRRRNTADNSHTGRKACATRLYASGTRSTRLHEGTRPSRACASRTRTYGIQSACLSPHGSAPKRLYKAGERPSGIPARTPDATAYIYDQRHIRRSYGRLYQKAYQRRKD